MKRVAPVFFALDMADPDIEVTLADAAAGPSEVRVGSELVRNHPLPELIEVANRAAAAKAAGSNSFGLRLCKLVPPGGG